MAPVLAASALLVSATLLLVVPGSAGGRRAGPTASARVRSVVRGWRSPPVPWVVTVVVLVGGGASATGYVGPVAIVAGVAGIVSAERGRARRRSRRQALASATEEYVTVLCAELAAGRTPAEALAHAADVGPPGAADAAAAAALGSDPVPRLRAAAAHSGAGAMHNVAAAWQLATTTGAPLVDVLTRAATAVRDDVAADNEVAEQIAPVRATGRVLAVLPLMGMVVGSGFGVNVPALLLLTGWGQACLVMALGLVSAGLWAVERIGERARGPA